MRTRNGRLEWRREGDFVRPVFTPDLPLITIEVRVSIPLPPKES